MWDLAGIGTERHSSTLNNFVAKYGMFIHAFELGGLRSWEENQRTLHFAEGWNQPIVGGGDRHGCEPSAVLNLSETENFTEFVHEVRKQRCTHVLFMPQYAEPHTLRVIQTLLDVIREYPEYPEGFRRWDQRVFHPDANGVLHPLCDLWTKPAWLINAIFGTFRLLEAHPVRSAMQFAFARPDHRMRLRLSKGEVVS